MYHPVVFFSFPAEMDDLLLTYVQSFHYIEHIVLNIGKRMVIKGVAEFERILIIDDHVEEIIFQMYVDIIAIL